MQAHATPRFEAVYHYRESVAKSISVYRANLRVIFDAFGSPIPPTEACQSAMRNAWDQLLLEFKLAERRLELETTISPAPISAAPTIEPIWWT